MLCTGARRIEDVLWTPVARTGQGSGDDDPHPAPQHRRAGRAGPRRARRARGAGAGRGALRGLGDAGHGRPDRSGRSRPIRSRASSFPTPPNW